MIKGDGDYCTYCKREMVAYTATHPTRDHVMPKSKGGRQTVPCCFTCNQLKGSKKPEKWQKFMIENPEWWKRSRIPHKNIKAQKWAEYDEAERKAGFDHAYRGREFLLR